MFTNSGRFTARFGGFMSGTRIAGVSLPFSSMCVRKSCVYGVLRLEEKASHFPFGDHVCQEFIDGPLHLIFRASPPSAGTINSSLSGRISSPLRHWQNTIHLPSGEIFGKKLLFSLWDAPLMASASPPLPSLNGTR